ncbi:MAG: hypothetical protein ACHP78_19970, partial [Terriglobales bacterium]
RAQFKRNHYHFARKGAEMTASIGSILLTAASNGWGWLLELLGELVALLLVGIALALSAFVIVFLVSGVYYVARNGSPKIAVHKAGRFALGAALIVLEHL